MVDDEPLARARMKRLLTMQGVEVVAEGENGHQAVELVLQHDIDILFIDINMPIKNGLQAVNELDQTMTDLPAVVFCTAYDEYAVEAFKTHAVAYLLKPVQASDIMQAIEKAASVNKFQREQLFEKEAGHKTLPIHYGGALQNMPITRFLYFKSENKSVFAVLDTGEEVFVDQTLKSLETLFIDDLVRAHRAFLMNKQHASRLVRNNAGAMHIEFQQIDFLIPVSRRHLSEVKKCFQ